MPKAFYIKVERLIDEGNGREYYRVTDKVNKVDGEGATFLRAMNDYNKKINKIHNLIFNW